MAPSHNPGSVVVIQKQAIRTCRDNDGPHASTWRLPRAALYASPTTPVRDVSSLIGPDQGRTVFRAHYNVLTACFFLYSSLFCCGCVWIPLLNKGAPYFGHSFFNASMYSSRSLANCEVKVEVKIRPTRQSFVLQSVYSSEVTPAQFLKLACFAF